MLFRTDLALELKEDSSENTEGTEFTTENISDFKITRIKIKTKKASEEIGKPIGNYVTLEIPDFSNDAKNIKAKSFVVSEEIKKMLPKNGSILIIGLGNSSITPDSLGPETTKIILATRHIKKQIENNLGSNDLRSVSVLAPGVLGQTGIEIVEILKGLTKKIEPSCVILIDALASKQTSRLGKTIQISNTGISPGSGVGNSRPLIDEKTIGVPIVSIGIPMVVDVQTLIVDLMNYSNENELEKLKSKINPRGMSMMVTPKDIDILIKRAAKLTGTAINLALHEGLNVEDFLSSK
ncbi:MAG: GPR endopeptidase [Oscillospiraceae bacterium]|jgi:spore protease|nr:GPR endopeptidase [Oscillospiraceae bacterium]